MIGTPKLWKWFVLAAWVTSFIALTLFSIGLSYGDWLQERVFTPIFGEPIDQMTRHLAGRDAIDCGRVRIRRDPAMATSCALEARAKRSPFRVAYDVVGTDSLIADGFAIGPDGRLFRVLYDGCPEGCGFSILRQSTYAAECAPPQNLVMDSHGKLTCLFAKPFDPDEAKHGPVLIFW